jgi:hypothetical protein
MRAHGPCRFISRVPSHFDRESSANRGICYYYCVINVWLPLGNTMLQRLRQHAVSRGRMNFMTQ